MQIVLIVLGFLLVGTGVLVLVRYAKAPGGTIKWLGLEVSSGSAGLPLIALGIGCVLVAAKFESPSQGGNEGATPVTSAETSGATSAAATAPPATTPPSGAQTPPRTPAEQPAHPADGGTVPAFAPSPAALRVRAILARHLDRTEASLDLHRDLYAQGLDQLDITESIMQVEEDCHVTFPDGLENERPISIDRLTQVLQRLHSGC